MKKTPLILVCGNAGSGKDAVADAIVSTLSNFIKIAQADEMKRFAKSVFRFTDLQLWGPSDNRNAVDKRFYPGHYESGLVACAAWDDAFHALNDEGMRWCGKVLGFGFNESEYAFELLTRWFNGLPREGLTPRTVLQTLGTEWGRYVKRNVWTEYTTRVADALLAGGNTYTPEGGLVLGTGHFDCVVITDGRFRNEVQNVRKQGGYVIKVESPVQTVRLNGHSSETELDSIPLSWFDAVLKNDKSHGLDALDWAVLEVLEQLGIQTQNHFATKSLSTNGVCIPNF